MWMAVGAMIVGMRVVMVMAVVVTVTMVRVPAIAVGTGLGLEGLLHLGDGQVHGAQHVGQHVVGLDLEVVGPEFDRHVAVAEVVGGAHEIEAAAVVVVSMAVTVTMTVVVIMAMAMVMVVVVAGRDAQHRLGRGDHAQQRAVLGDEDIAAAHHGAARQKDADTPAVGGFGVEAAFLADVPVECEGGGPAQQGLRESLALGNEPGCLEHGGFL